MWQAGLPAKQGRGTEIEVYGRLNTVLALASGQPAERERMLAMVPGVGLEPTTY